MGHLMISSYFQLLIFYVKAIYFSLAIYLLINKYILNTIFIKCNMINLITMSSSQYLLASGLGDKRILIYDTTDYSKANVITY